MNDAACHIPVNVAITTIKNSSCWRCATVSISVYMDRMSTGMLASASKSSSSRMKIECRDISR